MTEQFRIDGLPPHRLERRLQRYYRLRDAGPQWWVNHRRGTLLSVAGMAVVWSAAAAPALFWATVFAVMMLGVWVAFSVAYTGEPPDLLVRPWDKLVFSGRKRRLQDRINVLKVRLQLLAIDRGGTSRLSGTLLD
jgi:hypothetical protein